MEATREAQQALEMPELPAALWTLQEVPAQSTPSSTRLPAGCAGTTPQAEAHGHSGTAGTGIRARELHWYLRQLWAHLP